MHAYLRNHGGATPKMLHKKALSCTQQPVTSNIRRLSIKLLKLITRKVKNTTPSWALSGFLSAALCIASEFGHHSINLLPTEVLSHRAIRESFLPPLCRAARNEGMVCCFRPHATAELLQGPLLGLPVLRADTVPTQGASSRNRNNSGIRTFMIRWKSSGHRGVVESFSC